MALRVDYAGWQDAIRAVVTLWNTLFSGDRLAAGVDTVQDVIIDNDAAGVVLKSPNGHYWRASISNTGVLTWTDIGTTKP